MRKASRAGGREKAVKIEKVWSDEANLTLIAFALVLGVMFALNGSKTGFWYDELWSLDAISGSLSRMLTLLQDDFHPPGYHLLLYGWTRLVGATEFTARALSMLFLLGCIPLTYRLGRALGLSTAGALFGTGLTAFVNGTFIFGLETRPYAMLLFLSMFALYFTTQAVRDRAAFFTAAIAGIVAIYSHYAALFTLVPAAIIFAIQERNRRPLALAAVWTGALAPWAWQLVSQARHFSSVGWLKPPTFASATADLATVSGLGGTWLIFVLLFAAVFVETFRRGHPEKRLWLVLPVAVAAGTAIASHAVIPIFHTRYLLPALPLAFLASGFLIEPLGSRPRWFLALLFPLGLAWFTHFLHSANRGQNEDWRGAAEYVLQHKSDADIAVTTARSRFFQHYIPDVVVLQEDDAVSAEQWISHNGNASVWFLQARDFSPTNATRTLAARSESRQAKNFAGVRVLLLQLRP